jgi:hypothetical protein
METQGHSTRSPSRHLLWLQGNRQSVLQHKITKFCPKRNSMHLTKVLREKGPQEELQGQQKARQKGRGIPGALAGDGAGDFAADGCLGGAWACLAGDAAGFEGVPVKSLRRESRSSIAAGFGATFAGAGAATGF